MNGFNSRSTIDSEQILTEHELPNGRSKRRVAGTGDEPDERESGRDGTGDRGAKFAAVGVRQDPD